MAKKTDKKREFNAVEVLGAAIRDAISECYDSNSELQKMSELDYYEALADALDGEKCGADMRVEELRDEEDAGEVDEDDDQ